MVYVSPQHGCAADGNKSAQGHLAERRKRNNTARERLYPYIPSTPRPLSQPLAEYAGIYTHAAHPDFIISVTSEDEPQLNVRVTGAFRIKLRLKHVSADYFLAEVWSFVHATDPDTVVRAEFRLDVTGKVRRFGAAVDFADMPDTLIWFEKAN